MKSILVVALIASTLALSFAGNLDCDCFCSDGRRFTVYNAVNANTCQSKVNICRYPSSFISRTVCKPASKPQNPIPQPTKTVFMPLPTPAVATIYQPAQPTQTVYMPQPPVISKPSQATQTVYLPQPSVISTSLPSQATQTVYLPQPEPTKIIHQPRMDEELMVADDFLMN